MPINSTQNLSVTSFPSLSITVRSYVISSNGNIPTLVSSPYIERLIVNLSNEAFEYLPTELCDKIVALIDKAYEDKKKEIEEI